MAGDLANLLRRRTVVMLSTATIAMILLAIGAGLAGCGTSNKNNQTTSGQTAPTPAASIAQGTWTITLSGNTSLQTGDPEYSIGGTMEVSFAPPATPFSIGKENGVTSCSASWIDDYGEIDSFSTLGPVCFTADPDESVGSFPSWTPSSGSIGTGATLLLIGVPSDPPPAGSSFNFFYLENAAGGFIGVSGEGTITNGVMTATWTCTPPPGYLVCVGTGPFTGTQQ